MQLFFPLGSFLYLIRNSWMNLLLILAAGHLSSAPDGHADGHEGAESASALEHELPRLRDQLPAPKTHPEGAEPAEDGPGDHAHGHSHHEPGLGAVEARSSSLTSLWRDGWHLDKICKQNQGSYI